VLLPAIRPVLLVVLLYRTVDTVRVFDTVFIQTNGANGTQTLSLLAYRPAGRPAHLGLGSAVSVLLFLLAAAIAVGFVWVFRADLRELSQGGDR
jgi:ABC-type sugar transport systems, permease components